jgi:leader peptidase (prepilin peptidase)/N-methyltransferase
MGYLIFFLFFYLGCAFGSLVPTIAEVEGEYLTCESFCCAWCRKRFNIIYFIPLALIFCRRCSHCAHRVSLQCLVAQILSGLALVFIYRNYGANIPASLLMLLAVCLIIMSFIDLKCRAVPDLLQLVVAAVGILYAILSGAVWRFLNVLLVFLAFLAVSYLFKKLYKAERIGMGDIMLLGTSNFFLT